jgi:chemotaxis protein MotB
VLQYIQEKAELKPELFQATSFGEHRPVASNDTPEGRRSNRRVEIYLKDKTADVDFVNEDTDLITVETSFNESE